jgi:taurine dioxygenase
MQIEKASDGIGAIASGINVAALTDEDWRALKQAWLDHHVLIVRGQQDLPIDVFLDYGRRFGRVQPHPVVRSRHSEIPELTVMGIGTKKADGTFDKSVLNRGQGWHTDGPWDHTVCNATQLLGLEIPSTGGDTLFANMHMALEALPTDLRARIQGLDAHHIYGGADRKSVDLLPPEARNRPPTRYPLVRAHAETGRETLYFNPFHILKIADIPEAESDALIAELTEHMIAPGADYRHRWQTGDLVTWDNRCTLHAATGGYPIEEKRIHWRCTIMAEG